ncbi:helix-turn-helix transcriptional regulator [Parahaliea maris]|uniref:Helix-turn-helix transcriptional regulator n=1 Tax=Parahaliea maris TaxID=2716870 RepID=A0A5C8ZM81_9GAMM|nr:helix-turn-helix transcriptional regulator [Parahaliea maris]
MLDILLDGDLSRLRAESVAEQLGMSCTTLRRRLRADHTHYQFLLDRARQYRCEQCLKSVWLPGKCLADELGYLEVNSFYRAFRRWTGFSYSEYKLRRERGQTWLH